METKNVVTDKDFKAMDERYNQVLRIERFIYMKWYVERFNKDNYSTIKNGLGKAGFPEENITEYNI